MSIPEEIQNAIGAHGLWKHRLRSAVDTGRSEFSASTVCLDNQCPFGKWLYSVGSDIRATSRWKCVKTAHADFHREAAKVLELALAGRTDEARTGLGFTSPFAAASAKLTQEMMAWKKEAA